MRDKVYDRVAATVPPKVLAAIGKKSGMDAGHGAQRDAFLKDKVLSCRHRVLLDGSHGDGSEGAFQRNTLCAHPDHDGRVSG